MTNHTQNPANSGQSSILLHSELERLSGLLKVLNASASLCQSSGSLCQCEIKNPSDFETLERYLGYLVEDCARLQEAAQQLEALVKEIGQ